MTNILFIFFGFEIKPIERGIDIKLENGVKCTIFIFQGEMTLF